MLLYTRLAPPKVPKRRSRAGCTYCKEKKKKCDEGRPQCSRCAERCLECIYEPVKPRQRRKGSDAPISRAGQRRFSEISHDSQSNDEGSHEEWYAARQGHGPHFEDVWSEQDVFSPLETSFDPALMSAYAPTKLSDISPAPVSRACDFAPPELDELEDVEEVAEDENSSLALRRDFGLSLAAQARSLSPDLAMIAPIPVASPLRDFCAPAFSEFSERPNRRALVDHFCNVLSHLIVFREETGNPFQQLVLPLTQKSTPVMNAIYALASAHLEYRGVQNTEKSLYFHNQAIQGLTRLIEHDRKVKRNESLAAIMLLVYYEVLVQKARSNIVDGHLKGALAIMRSNTEPTNPTSLFLERAFRFYDVIAALSFGTAPLSTAPAAGCLAPFPPMGAPAASPLCNVDTLLGMATTLWPIIHRLSTLRSLKSELEKTMSVNPSSSKAAVLRTELETNSEAIKVALKQWQPCLPPNFVPDDNDSDGVVDVTMAGALLDDNEDPLPASAAEGGEEDPAQERGRIHSILHNALAYRHSAFVYLYRTIYGHDRSHPLVQQHAHASLRHCARTVAHAGPMGALLWPLFVAACEAVSPADRDLAGRAFTAVERRQGMTNIGRAWDIVSEVWRRADDMDAAAATTSSAAKAAEEAEAAKTAAAAEAEPVAAAATAGPVHVPVEIVGPSAMPMPVCSMATGLGSHDRDGPGADLWRRVSQDMGVNIVFG